MGWICTLLACVAGFSYYVLPQLVVLPAGLDRPLPPSPVITDRHGEPLRRPLGDDDTRRTPVDLSTVPGALIHATLSAEDKRFYSHGGVDFLALARAAHGWATGRKNAGGASTITQQLIKLARRPPPVSRTPWSKVTEVLAARKLEMRWTKDAVLAAYLNHAPYGNLHTGVREAARGYFGKPVGDLSAGECAFLAAIPNAPGRFNPYRNWSACKERQVKIVHRAVAAGWLTEREGRRAIAQPLKLHPRGAEFSAPHFVDTLLRRHPSTLPAAAPVESTLDLGLQERCEAIVRDHVERLRHQRASSGAVVVIENRTRDVLAMVGSPAYHSGVGGQVNATTSPRSPGSALKPFVYLLALEKGMSAGTVLADTPLSVPTSTGVFTPVNFDHTFRGPVTVRTALATSLNVPAVRLLNECGGAAALQERLGQVGVTTLTEPPDVYGLGLSIGNAEVTLLELTNAYACIASGGVHRPFRLVRTPADHPAGPPADQVFNALDTFLVADILSDNAARSPAFGLASPLQLPFRAAAKTGTSSDFRDNWTIGFTPEFTVGAWVGNIDNSPMDGVSGLSGAGPIFHDVMRALAEQHTITWFPTPEELVAVTIDPLNGLRPPRAIEESPETIRSWLATEWFRTSRIPDRATMDAYDDAGRTRLHPVFASWFQSPYNHLEPVATIDDASPFLTRDAAPFAITSPPDGARFFLDPDLPSHGSLLPLAVTTSRGPVTWSSDSLRIQNDHGKPVAILAPGTHTLRATDTATGESRSVTIEVESL